MILDLLAFGAHPDDVELFAGGTLAKMGALGYATGIVDMSRGELGTRGTPRLRAKEARTASRALGLRVRENLDLPDGSISAEPRNRRRVIEVLREFRPAVVLVHYWEDRHPDHVHTSRLVSDAVHHAGLAKIRTGQERFRPQTLLYYHLPASVQPSFVVDISEVAEQRLAAIKAYRSQLHDPARTADTYLSRPDFLTHVENLHAYYGTLIGVPLGEGFHTKEVLGIPDPVDFFKKHPEAPFR